MLTYKTTNLFIALGKLVALKLEVCTKNQIPSFKNYAVNAYNNDLREIHFPNYEYFEDASKAYSAFLQELMTFTDNSAPCKTKRAKEKTQTLKRLIK